MPISLTFLIIGLLASWAAATKRFKPSALIHVIAGIYAVSFLPSLTIPYIIDDTDHLFQLTAAMESGSVGAWLMTPHNEHVIPLLRSVYYLCYKYFWIYPQPFHFLIIGVAVGTLYLVYALIKKLSKSEAAGLFGAALFASTNTMDLAIFVITNSHIIFCLFFLLLILDAQAGYAEKRSWIRAAILLAAPALASSTFSLGLFAFPAALAFDKLCLPAHDKAQRRSALFYIFIGWALACLPYAMSADKIIYAKHYQDLGAGGGSALKAMHIFHGAQYLGKFLAAYFIPFFLPFAIASMIVAGLCCASGWINRRHVAWRAVVFFAVLGLGINWLIVTFRIQWGEMPLGASRYNVFPALAVAFIYALMAAPFFKSKFFSGAIKTGLVYAACFLLISAGAGRRYNHAQAAADQTNQTLQRFNLEYNQGITGYFNEHPQVQALTLSNAVINWARLSSLRMRTGFMPDITRYPRSLWFYGHYLLPPDIRNRVIWGEQTDPLFLQYLQDRQSQILLPLLKS